MEQEIQKPKKKGGRKASTIPLSERRKQYYENRKEQYLIARENAKNIKKGEDASNQNLFFISHFIKSQGLNMTYIAEKLGVTAQALSWMFIKDDTNLNNAKKIFNAMGLELIPEIFQTQEPEKKITIKEKNFEIVGDVPPIQNYIENVDRIVAESLKNKDNLAFLAKFLVDNKITLSKLSQKTDITLGTLNSSFKRKNIQISNLYKIVNAYETKIIWRVKAID